MKNIFNKIAKVIQDKSNNDNGTGQIFWMETDYIHKNLFTSCEGRIREMVESTVVYIFKGGRYVRGGGIPNKKIGYPGPYIYHKKFECDKCRKTFKTVLFQKKYPIQKVDLSELIRKSRVV